MQMPTLSFLFSLDASQDQQHNRTKFIKNEKEKRTFFRRLEKNRRVRGDARDRFPLRASSRRLP